MKLSKKIYIIGGGVLTLLVVVITLIVVLTNNSDDNNDNNNPSTNPPTIDPDEVPIPFENALIVKISNSSLWARDLDSDSSIFLIKNWRTSFLSFDFYLKKNIYFVSNVSGETITSYSNRFPQLDQPGTWSADKIAVDYVHEKVYVIDGLAAKINVFDVWTSRYNIISVDLNQPRDIAVDSVQGYIFVLQLSSILKTNLDGTSPKVIVQQTDISAFSIDVDEQRVYMATIYDIQSVDYAGQNKIIVEKITDSISSLAVSKNSLFWINPSSNYETTFLWSCNVIGGVCKDTTRTAFDGNAVELKAYNFTKLQVTDPCKSMSNCEHMCINSVSGPRCVCSIGWQLKNNSQSCETVDDFLLYIQGEFVKARTLDFSQDAFVAAILPVKLNITNLMRKQVLDFDFDARSREIFFSDDYSISRINLKPDSKQATIGGDSKDNFINPVIDWVTRNVYYVRALYWFDFIDLLVRNMDPYDSSIASNLLYSFTNDQTPRSLVVHPNRGYLFLTIVGYFPEQSVRIVRHNLDGTQRKFLGQNLSVSDLENGLAIDFDDDRLFWFDQGMKKVHSSDLECSDVKTIDVSIVHNAKTINVYEEWIYISNLTSVWRFHKKTGQNITKVLPMFGDESQPIRGAKVFSQKSQFIDSNHPCAGNNGGCKRYCFARPKLNAESWDRVCECNDNEKLDSDGKNCIGFS